MVVIAKGQELKVKTKLTYEEFLEICPNNRRYELVDGEIVDTSGNFSSTSYEKAVELTTEYISNRINQISCAYEIKNFLLITQQSDSVSDICILEKTIPKSIIQILIEIVSYGWEEDYIDKFEEYQCFGIPEYWIVDYKAIASREFLGNPKIPTVFVNLLDENGKYQTNKFTGDDKIISRTFPELDLTAAQILNI
jgi:Uma2 family endonuclease